ncbi:adenylate kinase [Ornithinimicrobium sp. F0845]|uniref:adenylate kinase n=1 Tax=Ornithinimicrobium sp. F0845 TaxID=2926412 RepID=UPI001FF34024|nr:adenylate kinase [Ornithinimicrobium sp. F0845]MCK0111724.1 adenylate kinase [Ornithinimicrobium sp. F0845]
MSHEPRGPTGLAQRDHTAYSRRVGGLWQHDPVTPAPASRILVYGVTGSGKTTLARRIGEVTGLPWHSVDDEIGWLPGWTERPVEDQRRIAEQICAGEEWVLDTAYGKWIDVPLARVELIVALEYPRWVSLQRLLRRTVSRAVTRQEMCNGNTESWRQVVSRDSIVVWHFRSWARKRERIRQWVADPRTVLERAAAGGPVAERAAPQVVHLRSARQTQAWLATLDRSETLGS